MGFFSSLFGFNDKNSNKSDSSALNKNNPLDVCYAFGVLAVQVAPYDSAYIQVDINSSTVVISALLDEGYCRYQCKVQSLRMPQDFTKLGVPNNIAKFLSMLNAEFTSPYQLTARISCLNGTPTVHAVKDSIMRSQRTAKLPTKYNVQVQTAKRLLIQLTEEF